MDAQPNFQPPGTLDDRDVFELIERVKNRAAFAPDNTTLGQDDLSIDVSTSSSDETAEEVAQLKDELASRGIIDSPPTNEEGDEEDLISLPLSVFVSSSADVVAAGTAPQSVYNSLGTEFSTNTDGTSGGPDGSVPQFDTRFYVNGERIDGFQSLPGYDSGGVPAVLTVTWNQNWRDPDEFGFEFVGYLSQFQGTNLTQSAEVKNGITNDIWPNDETDLSITNTSIAGNDYSGEAGFFTANNINYSWSYTGVNGGGKGINVSWTAAANTGITTAS